MIELAGNFIQCVAAVIGCTWSSVCFYKSRKQPFYLLAFFGGVYSLSIIYWTLFLLLCGETPQIFYVADTGWITCYAFLLILLYTMRPAERKQRKTTLRWISPIFCIPQFILYITHGDVIYNLLICGLTMLIGWYAIEELTFILRNAGEKKAAPFYISVLCFVVLEYCLWTSSCFWLGDTLANPYFWFDFLLSATLLLLTPTLKKAVMK